MKLSATHFLWRIIACKDQRASKKMMCTVLCCWAKLQWSQNYNQFEHQTGMYDTSTIQSLAAPVCTSIFLEHQTRLQFCRTDMQQQLLLSLFVSFNKAICMCTVNHQLATSFFFSIDSIFTLLANMSNHITPMTINAEETKKGSTAG